MDVGREGSEDRREWLETQTERDKVADREGRGEE